MSKLAALVVALVAALALSAGAPAKGKNGQSFTLAVTSFGGGTANVVATQQRQSPHLYFNWVRAMAKCVVPLTGATTYNFGTQIGVYSDGTPGLGTVAYQPGQLCSIYVYGIWFGTYTQPDSNVVTIGP